MSHLACLLCELEDGECDQACRSPPHPQPNAALGGDTTCFTKHLHLSHHDKGPAAQGTKKTGSHHLTARLPALSVLLIAQLLWQQVQAHTYWRAGPVSRGRWSEEMPGGGEWGPLAAHCWVPPVGARARGGQDLQGFPRGPEMQVCCCFLM